MSHANGQDTFHVGKYDFYLLMESYRNTIELNTTLVERIEVLIRQNDAMLTNQGELTDLVKGFKEELHTEVLKNKNTVLEQYAEVKTRLNVNTVVAGSLIASLIGLVILILHVMHGG